MFQKVINTYQSNQNLTNCSISLFMQAIESKRSDFRQIVSLTTLWSQFLGNFGILREFDVVVRLILHEYGLQVNVVTDFIFTEVNISFSSQTLSGIHISKIIVILKMFIKAIKIQREKKIKQYNQNPFILPQNNHNSLSIDYLRK